MRRAAFLAQRRASWQRFAALVSRAESRGVHRLTGEEIASFSQALRSLCYDLATVRSRGFGRDVDGYLNDLVVRGHGAFYGSVRGRSHEAWQFLAHGFPRLLRAHVAYFWLSAALFVLPAVVSGLVVGQDASLAGRVLPGTTLEELERMYSPPRDAAPEKGPAAPFGATGFYVWNNAGIAFRCFATGIFFGLGTLYYLVYNGIFLGTVAGFLTAAGHGDRFYRFVVGHGSFELTAIVIAGAAGLRLGHALVHPAPYTWGESLRQRGRAGARLAAGAGAMLAVAAVIEAFWSPLPLPDSLKYVAGALLWLLVAAYLALAGRGAPSPAA